MPRTKEEKYRLVSELMASEAWLFLKEDLEEQALHKQREVDGHFGLGSTNMTYLHHGIKEGIVFALSRPAEIKKECENFFKKLSRSVSGR